jgi:single-strand DNA-binding protein
MINKVILLGRVGRDPEVRVLQSGSSMCNLSVATSEKWKDRNTGERKERTQWHRIVIFNENLIRKFIEPYVAKGDLVCIEGMLEYRQWTAQDGTDRITAEIVIKQFVGNLTLVQSNSSRDYSKKQDEDKSRSTTQSNNEFNNFDDDEIPF